MKYIYIAGLEHSGTTLTDHLLSQNPGFMGLGEVSSFFSPGHMKQYMEKWGGYDDVSLCSCGDHWQQCEFWQHLFHLCGLNSQSPMLEKYQSLMEYVRSKYGENLIIVDSSKRLPVLKMVLEGHSKLGISAADMLIIFTVKDVRSYSASMLRKSGSKNTLLSVFHHFNLWHGNNKRILNFLESRSVEFSVNLYEKFCLEPDIFILQQLKKFGCDKVREVDVSHNHSHIAMGNKDFVMRNRSRIKYDAAWFNEDKISLMYLLHYQARRFNKKMYAMTENSH